MIGRVAGDWNGQDGTCESSLSRRGRQDKVLFWPRKFPSHKCPMSVSRSSSMHWQH